MILDLIVSKNKYPEFITHWLVRRGIAQGLLTIEQINQEF